MEFDKEINDKNFDENMRKNLIFNKYILHNKFLKYHYKQNEIIEKYKKISYINITSKMRDNTKYKHVSTNTTNTSVNTNIHIGSSNNQNNISNNNNNIISQVQDINHDSTNLIATINQLISNLRNANSNLTNEEITNLLLNNNNQDLDFNFEEGMEDDEDGDYINDLGIYQNYSNLSAEESQELSEEFTEEGENEENEEGH